MWLFPFWLSCCSFDKMFFKISGLFTEFFKILESCRKVLSTTGDIREWWSYGVWDFDKSTFWPANFFLFHNFRIPSIRFFTNYNIPLMFRCKPLPGMEQVILTAIELVGSLLVNTCTNSDSFQEVINIYLEN